MQTKHTDKCVSNYFTSKYI